MTSMIRCLCLILLLCHSYVSAQSVTLSIDPGHQTVKVKSGGATEVIGISAAKYSLTGIFDPKSLETTEHKPGTATWTCSLDSAVFLPPAGVTPVPPAPVPGPSVSVPAVVAGKPSTWTSTATSVNAGQWKITYKATVSYVKIRKKDNQADGTFGPFTGTGTCTFKATEGNFRIVLLPDDNFKGRSLSSLGVGETGGSIAGNGIYVEPIGVPANDILPLQSFTSSDSSAFKMIKRQILPQELPHLSQEVLTAVPLSQPPIKTAIRKLIQSKYCSPKTSGWSCSTQCLCIQ